MFLKLTKNKELASDIALFIMALIWGSGFVIVKQSLDLLTPLQIIVIRSFIASGVLIILNLKRLKNIDKGTLLYGVAAGIFLLSGFYFQTNGLIVSSSGKSAFLTSIYVVFVPLFTFFNKKVKPDKYNFIAAFIVIIGIYFLTTDFSKGFYLLSSDMSTIIGAIFFGVQVAIVGIATKKHDPMLLAIIQIVTCMLIGGVVMLFLGEGSFVINKSMIPTLLYLGVVGSALTFTIQNVAQKYTNPTHAGIIMSLESVFGTIFGIIILNEQFTLQMCIGALIIFSALIIAETKLSFLRKKKPDLGV